MNYLRSSGAEFSRIMMHCLATSCLMAALYGAAYPSEFDSELTEALSKIFNINLTRDHCIEVYPEDNYQPPLKVLIVGHLIFFALCQLSLFSDKAPMFNVLSMGYK